MPKPTPQQLQAFDAQVQFWIASINTALDTGVKLIRIRGAKYDAAAFARACLEQSICACLAGAGWTPRSDREIIQMQRKILDAVITTIRDNGPDELRNAIVDAAELN